MGYNMDKRYARQILALPEVQAAALKKAEEIAARARALAPKDSGEYAASIEVSTERGGVRNDRTVAVVTATAPHSAAVEFGNSRTGGRGHHVLRRAAEGE